MLTWNVLYDGQHHECSPYVLQVVNLQGENDNRSFYARYRNEIAFGIAGLCNNSSFVSAISSGAR